MASRKEHAARPGRESLSKRLGIKLTNAIRTRDNFACVYCGATEQSSGAPLHLDHLTPRSQGGADVASNLVCACRSCNCRRQDKSLSVWATEAHQLVFTARSIRAHARRKLAL